MIIRCYGARGSIPVSGEIYNRYGVDATCIEIRTGNDEVIADAGSGIRRPGNAVMNEGNLHHTFLPQCGKMSLSQYAACFLVGRRWNIQAAGPDFDEQGKQTMKR